MRILIWQQFSSNHSSSFTVIGEFATRADAERAADEVRAILKRIEDWYTEHPDGIEGVWSPWDWGQEPSPPELELAAQYQIQWEDEVIDSPDITNINIVLDRLVIMETARQADGGGQPFDQIMERLGGKGYIFSNIVGEQRGLVIFDLTCTAPDETTAQQIRDKHLAFNQRVRRDGAKLFFDRWYFDDMDGELSFLELVQRLQMSNCADITYTFTQFDLESDNFDAAQLPHYGRNDIDELLEVFSKRPSDWFNRREIAYILGDIGDPRGIPALVEMLYAYDPLETV